MNEMYAFIAQILLLVGGVVLGIEGLIGANLLTAILGGMLGRLVMIVIGGAAGYKLYLLYLEKMKK